MNRYLRGDEIVIFRRPERKKGGWTRAVIKAMGVEHESNSTATNQSNNIRCHCGELIPDSFSRA
jgi:hypothetical protein